MFYCSWKGHENYQEYKKIFFSDKLEILKAITKKNKNLSNSLKQIFKDFRKRKYSKKISIKLASINSKILKKIQYLLVLKEKNRW